MHQRHFLMEVQKMALRKLSVFFSPRDCIISYNNTNAYIMSFKNLKSILGIQIINCPPLKTKYTLEVGNLSFYA